MGRARGSSRRQRLFSRSMGDDENAVGRRSKPGRVMQVVHGDEEGRRQAEKVPVPERRRPDTLRYVERKLWEKRLHRLERYPFHGGHGPPKSGRGGKYTWENWIYATASAGELDL